MTSLDAGPREPAGHPAASSRDGCGRSLNETRQWVHASARRAAAPAAPALMWTEEVIRRCHTLIGRGGRTMSRDLAYAFLEIGRLVERADMTTRVLDVQAGILMRAGADDPRSRTPTSRGWRCCDRSAASRCTAARWAG